MGLELSQVVSHSAIMTKPAGKALLILTIKQLPFFLSFHQWVWRKTQNSFCLHVSECVCKYLLLSTRLLRWQFLSRIYYLVPGSSFTSQSVVIITSDFAFFSVGFVELGSMHLNCLPKNWLAAKGTVVDDSKLYPARVRAWRACALRALGLLLADGAHTVGRGETFWWVN